MAAFDPSNENVLDKEKALGNAAIEIRNMIKSDSYNRFYTNNTARQK